MKKCWILILLVSGVAGVGQTRPETRSLPQPRISTLTIDSRSVAILHLRPGYVSSVRLPEEVSSVVVGDPHGFMAEHSPAEPLLVFVKPTNNRPNQTNLLITTKSGHQVSLHLVSDGRSPEVGNVDFVIEYEKPRRFLIQESQSIFLVAGTRRLDVPAVPTADGAGEISPTERQLIQQTQISSPDWRGKELEVAAGNAAGSGDQVTLGFSVRNNSDHTIDLLPPQIELAGPAKQQGRSIKAEPVSINDYKLTTRRLGPGARADGVVVFERPGFKQSSEGLMLRVARADEVDRPVLVPFLFTPPAEGEKR
jgi:hypothetical protein